MKRVLPWALAVLVGMVLGQSLVKSLLPTGIDAGVSSASLMNVASASEIARTVLKRPAEGICVLLHGIHVVDGDTVDGEVRLRLRIRLLDCWAPESRGPKKSAAGLTSKEKLRALADGRDGSVWIPLTSETVADALTMDRVLGHVWLNKDILSLSEHQVMNGQAFSTKDELVRRYPDQK